MFHFFLIEKIRNRFNHLFFPIAASFFQLVLITVLSHEKRIDSKNIYKMCTVSKKPSTAYFIKEFSLKNVPKKRKTLINMKM
jgi:hypothetical protein